MKQLILTVITLSTFCFVSYAQNVNEKVSEISKSLITQLTSQNRNSIAIVDFSSPNGDISELGRSLSNRLRINIAKNTQTIKIVNRSILQNALAEEQLFKDGIIDPATAKKIKFIGVEVIIIGEIIDYGNDYSIEIQLIDTETSDIVGGEPLELPKTESLKKLNERILVKENGKPTTIGESNDTESKNGVESFYPIEKIIGDLRVKVMGIQSTGNGLSIDFKIFNDLDIPAKIGIYVGDSGSNSTKINNEGDIYYSSLSKIADKSAKSGNGASELVSSKAWVNAKVLFQNIPELKNISLLQIGFFFHSSKSGWQYFPETYRNLPILK